MIDTMLVFDGTYSAANTPPWSGVAITTTRVSSNVLDLLSARDIGVGNDIEINVVVTAALTGGTSLAIDFETCATAGGSYTALDSSPVYPAAQLIAGARLFAYTLPINQLLNATAGVLAAPGRFCRLNYTVVGTFGAGAVIAFLTGKKDRIVFNAPPSNYTVSTPAAEV